MKKIACLISLCCCAAAVFAQRDLSEVEITSHQLADNLYYLEGAGGNIGVSIGEDGVFLVDDQFAPLTDRILAALAELTDQPVRFVINTHHHGDHVGGNRNLAEQGAVVVAHENVRVNLRAGFTEGELEQALSAEQQAALPIVTFAESVDFHLNGEAINVFHVPPAHTDGDSFVYFSNADVVHTGDVFRTTSYPRVDVNANGTFQGIVETYQLMLEHSNPETRFLPGHGVVSTQDDVREQLDMFITIRDRVQAGLDEGQSLEQVLAGNPTAEFDERWSGGVSGTDLVTVIYNELQGAE